jgi:hypothetical protein
VEHSIILPNSTAGAGWPSRVKGHPFSFAQNHPPDLQEEAVKTVLMQAELLCADLAEGESARDEMG